MEKLKDVIRNHDFNPEDYDGFMCSEFQFMRFFFLENRDLLTCFDEVNSFLAANGFLELNFTDFKEELSISADGVGLYADPYVNETNRKLILTINKYDPWNNSIDLMIVELIRLRKEKDWAKFQNPKNLALALSIETSKLLEQFLGEKPAEVNKQKIKEKLATVFSYSLLLAENYGLDIKEIVLEKIQNHNEEYPIENGKGLNEKADK
ncbi:MazG-like family protein [Aquiflexum gelatinilyticum]|uniref:MazG-like family protein n=1 Tax=Aquiflexum gelatinilyticum TaxID=2961943 RepID=UPI002167B4A1|nr:MazG-like family protein [Aquiflexum gelatinilyticum]MCS4432868.1 hypothetical protein [Aquiflexum gelatinilyticum]